MSIPNTTYRVLVEKLGDSDPLEFIGNEGEVFYNPDADPPVLKLSDGYTPGGISIGSEGTGIDAADANIWVEQFVSNDPLTSRPSVATSVEYDADGNIIALFINTMSDINEQHTSVAKFDPAGVKLWEVKLDAGTYTNGFGLAVDNTNGYIYVSGSVESISALLCLNTVSGGIVWGNIYSFGGDSIVPVVDTLSNGDPVIVGYNDNETNTQANISRISAIDGSIVWSRGLDGIGAERTLGMAVGPNDEIVAVGSMDQIGTGSDTEDHMLVAKYDSNGTLAWQKAVLFDAEYDCYGADADIDALGNVYVCGSYERAVNPEFGTGIAMCLFKLSSSGTKEWSRRVVGDCIDFASSIVVGPDNHLYLSGITGRSAVSGGKFDWVLAKYNLNGTVVWQRLIDNTEKWTYSSFFFNQNGGGSNLAVRNGYIAASGAVDDINGSAAVITQFDTAGTLWNSGPWEFIGASFSGLLDSTASNIVVSDANKTDIDIIESIEVITGTLDISISNYLVGTLYNANTDKYPNVGRYISTETNSYENAIVISVTKDVVFLSPLSSGNASYKVNIDGLYDGQQIKFLPRYLSGTNIEDASNIYVYVDKLYNAGIGVTGPWPWYPFVGLSQRDVATLTWDIIDNYWVPSPYNYD